MSEPWKQTTSCTQILERGDQQPMDFLGPLDQRKETTEAVSHEQAAKLLHNKFVVVVGDSIQRSVYKDIVLLLQKDKYLSPNQLKTKGEGSFELDCLVEGGCLGQMDNGTAYREVRQFQSDHHLVRFYFATRVYSQYMRSVLEDFRHGPAPDLVVVNSCLWDISRYGAEWTEDYKENLHQFLEELCGILPKETLVVWNLTMPLGQSIIGGFLVPEAQQLRGDVIKANFYSGSLADAYGMDVLDLHFCFRSSLHHHVQDGVHWNALAHRRITSLLLQHAAEAWGVVMLCPLKTVSLGATKDVGGLHPPISNNHASKKACEVHVGFQEDVDPRRDWRFEPKAAPWSGQMVRRACPAPRPPLRPLHYIPVHRSPPDLSLRPPMFSAPLFWPYFTPFPTPVPSPWRPRHPYMMRNQPPKRDFAPYTHQRPGPRYNHGHFY